MGHTRRRTALLAAVLVAAAPLAAQEPAKDARVASPDLYRSTGSTGDGASTESARAWLEDTSDLDAGLYAPPEEEPLPGSLPETDAGPWTPPEPAATAEEPELPPAPEIPPADGPLEGEPLCDALCKQRAQRGDAESQYLLGRHYLDGWGGKRKRRSAMRWMRRAAERKHPDAMYGYAWMLLSFGNPTARTRQVAKRWLRRAAVRGHEPARLLLSQVQAIGVHTPLFLPRWHDHRP